MELEYLKWDSEFLGVKVYRSENVNSHTLNDRIEIISANEEAVLVYLFSNKSVDFSNFSKNLSVQLVDQKVTYEKQSERHQDHQEQIAPYLQSFPEPKLIELAVQSGIYSRFNVDSRIAQSKFEELYRTWIINSVNKEIAMEVMVYYDSDELAGFITLGEKNKNADIGIVAVDSAQRGKGIGRALIKAADNWAVSNSYSTLQVVTQAENTPACKLYEKCGFQKISEQFVYHIWKEQT